MNNYNMPEQFGMSPTPFQLQALVSWAGSRTDDQLEILRQQLVHAIASYKPEQDNLTTSLALAARQQAVDFEIQTRGPIPQKNLLIVPWGKLFGSNISDWSLTDFTRLPLDISNTQEQEEIIFETQEHPLNLLLQPLPNNIDVVDDDELWQQFMNMDDETIQEIDAIGQRFNANIFTDSMDDLEFDLQYNQDEYETYRLSQNDLSGLPIISSQVINITIPTKPVSRKVHFNDFTTASQLPPRINTVTPQPLSHYKNGKEIIEIVDKKKGLYLVRCSAAVDDPLPFPTWVAWCQVEKTTQRMKEKYGL